MAKEEQRQLPEHVKVGLYTYEIIEADDEFSKVTGEEVHGLCVPHTNQIYVRLTGNKVIDADTLWHEIKHALWHLFSLRDNDDEERIVATLSSGELMILRDNPELFEFLMDVVTESEEE